MIQLNPSQTSLSAENARSSSEKVPTGGSVTEVTLTSGGAFAAGEVVFFRRDGGLK